MRILKRKIEAVLRRREALKQSFSEEASSIE